MTITRKEIEAALTKANKEIPLHLQNSLREGKIDQQLYKQAMNNTLKNLDEWLMDPNIDRISSRCKEGILRYIDENRWTDIVNAYRQTLRFGTGGIRGMMAFDRDSIRQMHEKGLDIPIFKGPNTINEIVLLRTSVGVAQFGAREGLNSIVIGYDSRVRGKDLAMIVAQLFLHPSFGFTVYFFDAPCPYPEVTFAIPNLQASMGILISASHNDYRYNGYKLSSANGSQFDPQQRDRMYNEFIINAKTEDIRLCPFKEAPAGKLIFLGGDSPVTDFDYCGLEKTLVNMHARHREHIKTFLLMKDLEKSQTVADTTLAIGYSAFHGAGTVAVPRLLKEVGFSKIWEIKHNELNKLNGLFPSFCSQPGKEQQPDPGDTRAAATAVEAFKHDYPGKFGEMDILIGTDPDADRCGVIVKVPREQQSIYNNQEWTLLPADDLWGVILWYRMEMDRLKAGKKSYSELASTADKFISLSVTTSDAIVRLAQKNGVGVVQTWVGFASLSAATRDIWDHQYPKYSALDNGRVNQTTDLTDPFVCQCFGMDEKRSFNLCAMEQSNGFSILGGPPKDAKSMGTGGHVRDKDGTFAALLVAEVAAWAKSQGKTLFQLIDEKIYLDPQIGLFVTGYEPDPMDGEYPGIEGDTIKKAILRRAMALFQLAMAGDLKLAGMQVKSAVIYRTGKYDAIYPPSYDFRFPDEGIRLYFDDSRYNHVTIRPSGTGNSLRFHTQLHTPVTRENLVAKKKELRQKTSELFNSIREMLKAPRNN